MRLLSTALVALFAMTSGSAAFAEPSFHVAPQISTLGLGAEVGVRVNSYVGVRAGFNAGSLTRNFSLDDVDLRGKATLRSYGATADYYPFGGEFRLSGGFRVNDNRIDVNARPSERVRIGQNVYSLAGGGDVTGRIEFNNFSPYLGVGWATTVFAPNITLGLDAGVLFHGKPRVSLASTSLLISPADLERERADIAKDASSYRIYPAIAVTLGYTF